MSTDPFSDRTPDSILDQRERAKKFSAEAAQRAAELAEQERHQRARQAAHERAAREVDDEVRAALFLRVMQAREGARPQAEVPPAPVYTQRQDEQLEAEQAAGRARLEKYAKRNRDVAAARERVSAEEKVGEDTTLPEFKAT